MSDDLRQQLGEVLYDFRDGLLDDVDQGVDRILELVASDPPAPDVAIDARRSPRRPFSASKIYAAAVSGTLGELRPFPGEEVMLTIGHAPPAPPPHLVVYRTADGIGHRAEGNLLEGIAVPAGATIEQVAFNAPAERPVTLLLDGIELPPIE